MCNKNILYEIDSILDYIDETFSAIVDIPISNYPNLNTKCFKV